MTSHICKHRLLLLGDDTPVEASTEYVVVVMIVVAAAVSVAVNTVAMATGPQCWHPTKWCYTLSGGQAADLRHHPQNQSQQCEATRWVRKRPAKFVLHVFSW